VFESLGACQTLLVRENKALSPSLRNLLPKRGEEAAAKPVRKETKVVSPAKENRLVRWYRETESELRKVVWPTRQEWTNLTLIVCIVTVVSAIFLGLLDFVFERLILLIR
jgi:preprotein translocase subunit SecE